MTEESYPSTSIPKSLAIAVSVILSIFILAGAFGNALVCNRLRSLRDLRKVPHYLLASLSLTGLLYNITLWYAIPIDTYNCNLPTGWPFTSFRDNV